MKKLIQPVSKAKIVIQFLVFLWIVVCNLVVQAAIGPLEEAGLATWCIFLINILFFLLEDPSYKNRFLCCFGGSLVGLSAACFLCVVNTALTKAGSGHLLAVMVPLTIVLFVIINVHPFIPMLFNNIAFAYFTIGLITPAATFAHYPLYVVGAFAGNLIINGGAVLIIVYMSKRFAKAAAAAAAAK